MTVPREVLSIGILRRLHTIDYHVADDRLCCPVEECLLVKDQTVGKDMRSDSFHIIRDDVLAALDESRGRSRSLQRECGSRSTVEPETGMHPRGLDHVCYV